MSVENEIFDVDVLFVGGGPANIAGALHLTQLIKKHNKSVDEGKIKGQQIEEPLIMVIEKGKYIGAHSLSGAVLDPCSLQELVPEYQERGFPRETVVKEDLVYFLTEKNKFRLPYAPPFLQNKGHYILSLNKFMKWMGSIAEEEGVEILTEFSGNELLYSSERIIGVRTGAKGIDKNGKRKSNFEPGTDIHSKITILGEGSKGSLTDKLKEKFDLEDEKNPQVYAVGIKEVWKLSDEKVSPGRVIHTFGWPLGNNPYGGGFIYFMDNNLASIGLAVGLDYKNPYLDPHQRFQLFKTHPLIGSLLENGENLYYGAKTIPEGGYYSVTKSPVEGVLVIGDAAGLLNPRRLKGVHIGIKSGMIAAEAVFDAMLNDDYSIGLQENFNKKMQESWIEKELYGSRNFRQCFEKGVYYGVAKAGLHWLLGGRGLKNRLPISPDNSRMVKSAERKESRENDKNDFKPDGELTCDKLTDVYNASITHEEDQPSHISVINEEICSTKCFREYGNPCLRFCPAQVYENECDSEDGFKLKLNPSNCLHCKTCVIVDPYNNIIWEPPEGGSGPNFTNL